MFGWDEQLERERERHVAINMITLQHRTCPRGCMVMEMEATRLSAPWHMRLYKFAQGTMQVIQSLELQCFCDEPRVGLIGIAGQNTSRVFRMQQRRTKRAHCAGMMPRCEECGMQAEGRCGYRLKPHRHVD